MWDAERLSPARSKVRDLPLKQISVGDVNVRKSLPPGDLEELKDSIRTLGLLEPIVVMETDDKHQFQLLIGQRRLAACEELNWKTIPAIVVGKKDEAQAIALSLAENIERETLTHRDAATAVTRLYELYDNDERRVANETGISLTTVRRYILIQQYHFEEGLRLAQQGKVSLSDVKRALEAAQWDVDKALRLLNTIIDNRMTRPLKKQFVAYVEKNPHAELKAALEEASKPSLSYSVSVDLTDDDLRLGLERACKELGLEGSEVADLALRDWLSEEGYLAGTGA
jgi:ParB family chromosome partitioning protein